MAKFEYGPCGDLILANKLRLDHQLPWLEQFPKNINTILDVGAGAGVHSNYFKEIGLTPTAIDYDDSEFLYHGNIEFIKTNLIDLDSSRKYDAIFLSHVVEHFPNLENSIVKLRTLLNDDGYLFIVVPAYEPIVCDNHWQVGWNCGQLAMTLATCGFDCSEAFFVEINKNICGWGKMLPLVVNNSDTDEYFNIALNKDLLPLGMQSNLITSEAGNVHIPDMVYCYGDEIHQRLLQTNESIEGFKFEESKKLVFENIASNKDIVVVFNDVVDITDCIIQIIILCEGNRADLRVALDSSERGDYAHCGEFYLGCKPGISYNKIYRHNFTSSIGNPNYDKVRRLVIGGNGENSTATIWVSVDGLSVFKIGETYGDQVEASADFSLKKILGVSAI